MNAHVIQPRSGQITVLGLARKMSLANPDHDYRAMRTRLIKTRMRLGYGVLHELTAERTLRDHLKTIRNPENPSQIGTLT